MTPEAPDRHRWRRIATPLAALAAIGFAASAVVILLAPWWWVGDCASHWHLHLLVLSPWPALVLRRWWLVPVVASSAVFAAPLLLPAPAPEPAPPAAVAPIQVVSANTYIANRDPTAAAAALLAEAADVLVVVELSQALDQTLRAADPTLQVVVGLPYGGMGMGLYTRRRILRSAEHRFGPIPVIEVTVATDAGPLRVLVVHPPPPLDAQRFALRRAILDGVAELAAASPEPVIVVGDVNCTPASPAWRRLLDAGGLRASGGTRRTWPSSFAPIGLAIDHILTGSGLRADDLERFVIPGSDHRGLRATIVSDGGAK